MSDRPTQWAKKLRTEAVENKRTSEEILDLVQAAVVSSPAQRARNRNVLARLPGDLVGQVLSYVQLADLSRLHQTSPETKTIVFAQRKGWTTLVLAGRETEVESWFRPGRIPAIQKLIQLDRIQTIELHDVDRDAMFWYDCDDWAKECKAWTGLRILRPKEVRSFGPALKDRVPWQRLERIEVDVGSPNEDAPEAESLLQHEFMLAFQAKKLKRLRSILLANSDWFKYAHTVLAAVTSRLEELSINARMSQKDWTHLAETCPKLTRLQVETPWTNGEQEASPETYSMNATLALLTDKLPRMRHFKWDDQDVDEGEVESYVTDGDQALVLLSKWTELQSLKMTWFDVGDFSEDAWIGAFRQCHNMTHFSAWINPKNYTGKLLLALPATLERFWSTTFVDSLHEPRLDAKAVLTFLQTHPALQEVLFPVDRWLWQVPPSDLVATLTKYNRAIRELVIPKQVVFSPAQVGELLTKLTTLTSWSLASERWDLKTLASLDPMVERNVRKVHLIGQDFFDGDYLLTQVYRLYPGGHCVGRSLLTFCYRARRPEDCSAGREATVDLDLFLPRIGGSGQELA